MCKKSSLVRVMALLAAWLYIASTNGAFALLAMLLIAIICIHVANTANRQCAGTTADDDGMMRAKKAQSRGDDWRDERQPVSFTAYRARDQDVVSGGV